MISRKQILDEAPSGATHYTYETRDQLQAYFKNNFTLIYVPDDLKVWQELKPAELNEEDIIIELKKLK